MERPEGHSAAPEQWSLDIIYLIVLGHDVLSPDDWARCLVVCKRWHRALRVPVLRRVLERLDKEGDNRGLGNMVERRRWKSLARSWLGTVLCEPGLVRQFCRGDISPLDAVDASSGRTLVEAAIELPGAEAAFAWMCQEVKQSDQLRLQFFSSLFYCCALRAVRTRHLANLKLLLQSFPEGNVVLYSTTSPSISSLPKVYALPRLLRHDPVGVAAHDVNLEALEVLLERIERSATMMNVHGASWLTYLEQLQSFFSSDAPEAARDVWLRHKGNGPFGERRRRGC